MLDLRPEYGEKPVRAFLTSLLKPYELYEHRGRIDGYALDDWLKAETMIHGTTA